AGTRTPVHAREVVDLRVAGEALGRELARALPQRRSGRSGGAVKRRRVLHAELVQRTVADDPRMADDVGRARRLDIALVQRRVRAAAPLAIDVLPVLPVADKQGLRLRRLPVAAQEILVAQVVGREHAFELAVELRRAGVDGERLVIRLVLDRTVEVHLVPDDRSAERQPPLVALVIGLGSADVFRVLVARHHRLVLEVLERLAAEAVRSAPRDDAYETRDVAAMLGGGLRDVDPELTD